MSNKEVAKDVTGRELKVGQKVAHTERGGYRGLRVSTVTKVTPKMVILDHVPAYHCEPLKREHGYVCIVEDVQ